MVQPTPEPFRRVLEIELALISKRRAGVFGGSTTNGPTTDPQRVSPLGLSFSGGGIRSATFNLGVIQGLAERGLLRYVDYLSTVSGGGYIGSWLHGLIRNTAEETSAAGGPDTNDATKLAAEAKRALADVEEMLSPLCRQLPTSRELDPVGFLRKYSNYLAPRLGLFSADAWVIAFIWLRNVLLNQLILLPAIAAGVALALIAVFLKQVPWRTTLDPFGFGINVVAGTIAVTALLTAGWMIGRSLGPIARQSLKSTREKRSDASRRLEQRAPRIVALVFAAIVALGAGYFSPHAWPATALLFTLCLGVTLLIQWWGGFIDCFVGRREKTLKTWLTAVFHVGWMSISTALVATLLVNGVWGLAEGWVLAGQAWRQVVFGPPLIGAAFIASVMLLVGLMGVDYPDAAREWTARIGAMLAMATAAWLVLLVLSVLGPWGVSWLLDNLPSVGISGVVAWILTSAGGVLAGNSERTKAGSGSGKTRVLELLVRFAPTVFLIGYIILIAAGVHLLLDRHVQPGVTGGRGAVAQTASVVTFSEKYPGLLRQGAREPSRLAYLLLLLAVFVAAAAIASARININEFSLHHFYKNRLVRAYLGASKSRSRDPNLFTGFDPLDDFPLSVLTADPAPSADGSPRRPYFGPYPIVNATLNLNTGSELAQQERKAAPFVFTPAFSGFDPVTARAATARKTASDSAGDDGTFGYRPTVGYAEHAGPYLGTTMAISGAAANPNSGYHTSGPMAFLLTLFNARLGWWLGNPRFGAPSRKAGPDVALKYLFAELLGQTTADTKFVNLSDGGHFDNLGLYELVRRRCRFIVVCDSEEDGELAFGSLGGAIRKCRADFGVEIDINPEKIRPQNSEFSGVHCVVGTILYPEEETAFRAGLTGTLDVPGSASRRTRGWLLYLKSSLTGDEPADVLEYRTRSGAFPHESTGDQFFSESQFESYRRLGLHVCRTVFDGIPLPSDPPAVSGTALERQYPLVSVFQHLAQKWYAPIPISAEAASRLADSYVEIMRTLAGAERLQPLFRGLQAKRLENEEVTPELLASAMALVQLIQNVYTEFHLADPFNRANPKNAGWMQVFREWAASDLLSNTIWPQIKDDYHPQFQRFFETLGGEQAIDVPIRW